MDRFDLESEPEPRRPVISSATSTSTLITSRRYDLTTIPMHTNVPIWTTSNDLPRSSDGFVYAVMLLGNRALVLKPENLTIEQLASLIKSVYGPTLIIPDPFGLHGVNSIGDGYITFYSIEYRSYVIVYNLIQSVSLVLCSELTGKIPRGYKPSTIRSDTVIT